MQLRLTPPLITTVSVSGFKQGISAILSGLTLAGAFSTVIFSSNLASEKVRESLDKFVQALKASPLYDGIEKVGLTFKDWGSTVVSTKDDFKSWLHRYLGADGLKSGVAQLVEKLRDWSLIVYNWFKDKFIAFIKNIPKMVQEWDKLRLSLFKWGTFLGGGGSSALWAVFSSGENFDKFSKLMERDDFGEMMSKFSELVEENDEAFKNMDSEDIQEIIEKYLDEPDEAKKTTEELLEKQKEMKKEAEEKKEEGEDKPTQLEEEEIKEAFNPSQKGAPKTVADVFSNMASSGLQGLLSSSTFDSPISSFKKKAKEAMEKNIKSIEEAVAKEKPKRKPSVQAQFLGIIKDEKEKFIDALADVAAKAFQNIDQSLNMDNLSKKFVAILEGSYTEVCQENEECQEVDMSKIIKSK